MSENTEYRGPSNFIYFATNFITPTVALTILLSASFHIGYFIEIKRSYFELMSTTDYVASFIFFIPAVIAIHAVNHVIMSISSRIAPTYGDKIKEISRSKLSLVITILIMCAMVTVVLLVLFILFAPVEPAILFALVAGVGLTIFLWDRLRRTPPPLPYAMHLASMPASIVGACVLGNLYAYQFVNSTTGHQTIETQDGRAIEHVLIGKIFSTGVLFKNIDQRKIVFLKWEAITSINTEIPEEDTRIRTCRKLSILCQSMD